MHFFFALPGLAWRTTRKNDKFFFVNELNLSSLRNACSCYILLRTHCVYYPILPAKKVHVNSPTVPYSTKYGMIVRLLRCHVDTAALLMYCLLYWCHLITSV